MLIEMNIQLDNSNTRCEKSTQNHGIILRKKRIRHTPHSEFGMESSLALVLFAMTSDSKSTKFSYGTGDETAE
jgi:hypothetical protein